MKSLVYISLLLLPSFLLAQVGIGTVTPRATLEVSNNGNGGVLIPQYALTGSDDATTVANPQGGLLVDGTLVYNTTDVTGGNAIPKGIVYWDGPTSTWIPVGGAAGGSTVGWELTGNSVGNNDFLGTTNFQSLRFRTNNTQVGLFHPSGGINLGRNADSNNNNGIAIGINAQALGNNAIVIGGGGEADSQNAIAIGNANAQGQNAVAIGNGSEAQGQNSAAFGAQSDASGQNSVAIGRSTDASGLNSAAFGPETEANGQNATALGFQANAPNPATIILGNDDTNASNFTSSKIGIGTNNPTAKLQVNGSIRFVDGNQAAGRVLTSDGNGNATWQDASGGGGTASGWELTGNSVGNNDFLGTTNFQALRLRANNQQVALFDTGGGIAIGRNAVANNFNNGTAVGTNTDASGQNSSAFGFTASATGQNATAIGFGADAPNQTTIILGNNDTSTNFGSSRIGIGTNAPTAKLQVNGSIRYVDGNEAAGLVLTSDGNGNATWQSGAATTRTNLSYIQLYSNSSNALNVFNNIPFNTVDLNNDFNVNNSVVQTQFITGVYKISYTINIQGGTNSAGQTLEFFTGRNNSAGNKIPGSSSFSTISNGDVRTITKTFLVEVNNTFQQFSMFANVLGSGGNAVDVTVLNDSSFTMQLILAD